MSDAKTDAPGASECPFHQWREDFPINWEADHYVTRRELTKFLCLGSGLLFAANAALVVLGQTRKPAAMMPRKVAALAEIPAGGSMLFRYPTEEDPCILVREADGTL